MIPEGTSYDALVDRLRIAIASAALLVPSAVFALNAFISYRERGLVEPFDIPSAIAFLITAVLVLRRSLTALVGGAILCAIYLASVVGAGPPVFIAYWVVALILTLQALPLVRRRASTT